MKNKFSNIQNTSQNIDSTGFNWTMNCFSHPERTVRLGTVFSGIGAVEQAFNRLNLNCKIQFAGDIDGDCKKAYFANYSIDEQRWHEDICTFDATPFKGQVDLLVGGAPCQAFSIRGKRGGFEDTRGTLFSEFARVVIESQPKIFIFENVKGLLNHDKGHTWNVIKKTFEEDCGYDVYYQVLNSKDYGIPQSRDRVFCIGFKKKVDFKYPAPIPLEKKMYDLLEREVDSKLFLKEKGVRFITKTINHQKSYTQINGEVMLCQKRNQQFNWHGDFVFHPVIDEEAADPSLIDYTFKVADYEEGYFINESIGRYQLLPIGNNKYSMSRAQAGGRVEKGCFRKLSPRECLRLMGFDDSFKIVVSDTACYKQSGNSIVVDVLMAILSQIDITKYGV